jgi:hypothetical protein
VVTFANSRYSKFVTLPRLEGEWLSAAAMQPGPKYCDCMDFARMWKGRCVAYRVGGVAASAPAARRTLRS